MRYKRGMTLFIAIVVMSILLFITFAVTNIAVKGTMFASSGRDSQYAFYAADAGLECAIYWDSRYVTGTLNGFNIYGSAFSTSSSAASINCSNSTMSPGQAISGTSTATRLGGGGDSLATSTFGFQMNQGINPVPYCTVVTVSKYYVDSDRNGSRDRLMTYIKSRGYNNCDLGGSRRVERGVEVTY